MSGLDLQERTTRQRALELLGTTIETRRSKGFKWSDEAYSRAVALLGNEFCATEEKKFFQVADLITHIVLEEEQSMEWPAWAEEIFYRRPTHA